MSYFSEAYGNFRLPLDGPNCFRPVQVAAIQATTAHFFSDQTPAMVVMPTGTGKTAVLASLCFTLRAERVLVLTPSKIVRDQITTKLASLEEIKRFGALPALEKTPSAVSLAKKISDAAEWEALRSHDAVVTIPICVSSHKATLPKPPDDLFDLVIVDEAHHSPAVTWSHVLASFPKAKKVLLTATPFRRDKKEIKAKVVFTYDLKRARADKLFGDLQFQPVELVGDESADVAVAKATEKQFNADRSQGFDHLIFVRTDSVQRGEDLVEIYKRHTNLRLELILGSTSQLRVKKVVEQLNARALDGIIAVNMFGEGFDFPSMKIAAVHSPHKSLAVTLQFIGRFARTAGKNLGVATFLAEPRSAKREIDQLFVPGAQWADVVANLASARVEQEAEIRAKLDTFERHEPPALDEVSLWSIRPYFHVKVLRVGEIRDLSAPFQLPGGRRIVDRVFSPPENATVIVTQIIQRQRWSNDERLSDVHYDLFILKHSVEHGLLFICSTSKSPEMYAELARKVTAIETPRPLSAAVVNRALNDIDGLEFFSVGMRRRSLIGGTETYRTMSGPDTAKTVDAQDGELYDRGHLFGKGRTANGDETIGISTASKIWSNRSGQIPELMLWCSELAEKINSGVQKPTGSGVDRLSTGETIDVLPPHIVGMSLAAREYQNPRFISPIEGDAPVGSPDMTDLSLSIERHNQNEIEFAVTARGHVWRGAFVLNRAALVEYRSGDRLWVHGIHGSTALEDYFSEYPPTFFTGALERIEGMTLYRPPGVRLANATFQSVNIDWAAAGVDITSEKVNTASGMSIFTWLQQLLISSSASFVFCDDNAGEVADFIAMESQPDPVITLYHCKGSGAKQPGKRVTDLHEVCCQAIRSSAWVGSDRLLERLESRSKRGASIGLLKGKMDDLRNVYSPQLRQRVKLRVAIVQPGLRVSKVTPQIAELLTATKGYVINSGFENLLVFASP